MNWINTCLPEPMKAQLALSFAIICAMLLVVQCAHKNQTSPTQVIHLPLGISLDSAKALAINAGWKLERDGMGDSQYTRVSGRIVLVPSEQLTYGPLFFPNVLGAFTANLLFRNNSLSDVSLISQDAKYISTLYDYLHFKALLCSAYGVPSDTGIRILRGNAKSDTIYYANWGVIRHGDTAYTVQFETLNGMLGFDGTWW